MILTNITYTLTCGHQSDSIRYGKCRECNPHLEAMWDALDTVIMPAVDAYWHEQQKGET